MLKQRNTDRSQSNHIHNKHIHTQCAPYVRGGGMCVHANAGE